MFVFLPTASEAHPVVGGGRGVFRGGRRITRSTRGKDKDDSVKLKNCRVNKGIQLALPSTAASCHKYPSGPPLYSSS